MFYRSDEGVAPYGVCANRNAWPTPKPEIPNPVHIMNFMNFSPPLTKNPPKPLQIPVICGII